jgi:transcriptional regulator with XRE-family HTH domain
MRCKMKSRKQNHVEVWMYVKNPAKLRRRRRDRGLSQVQLGAFAGCTQQYVSLIEKGDDRDVSEKIAEKISRCLDVDLEDYFDERRVVPMTSIATDPRVGRPSRAPRRERIPA